MSDYTNLLSSLVDELKTTLLRAFEAGRSVGRSEGEAALRREPEGLLNQKARPANYATAEPVTAVHRRAPKGPVPLAILGVLLEADEEGKTADEILQDVQALGHTLLEAETIRTTLQKLAIQGYVTQIGENNWALRTEGFTADALEPSN